MNSVTFSAASGNAQHSVSITNSGVSPIEKKVSVNSENHTKKNSVRGQNIEFVGANCGGT